MPIQREQPNLLQRVALKAAQGITRLAYPGSGSAVNYMGMGWGRSIFWGTQPGTTIDYAGQVGELWKGTVVSICLSWIAENFPEPELMVEMRTGEGDWEQSLDHDLVDLINNPNPDWDGDDLWAATLLSWWTDGNAYWYKGRAGGYGKPKELWYIPHWMMKPARDKTSDEFITHYIYTPNGKPTRVNREDIVHFRYGRDPENAMEGMSPLKWLLKEIFTDMQASTYSAALLKNMGVPGVIITPKPDQLSPASLEEATPLIEAQWGSLTGDGSGKPLILDSAIDVNKLGFSPEELALEKLVERPEARICAAMRVPAAVIGLNVGDKQKTYSNVAEMREATFENNIMPTQRRFKRTLTRQLLPDFNDNRQYRVEWDYSKVAVLQEDVNAIWDRALKARQANVITVNETRAVMGYKETDDPTDDELGEPAPPPQNEPPIPDPAAGD